MATDASTPVSIRQSGPRSLAIEWADGEESSYDVRQLRLACGCAHCVDEWTGEGRLDASQVPEDVHPLKLEPVGRYAIQIDWSDGHSAGIYPFRRLRELAQGGRRPPRSEAKPSEARPQGGQRTPRSEAEPSEAQPRGGQRTPRSRA